MDNAASSQTDGGGAVYAPSGITTITNSTFVGNTATPSAGSGHGGAILFGASTGDASPGVTLTNDTISGNQATSGASISAIQGSATIRNTILTVASNGFNNCVLAGTGTGSWNIV